ncbi:response regulator [Halobacteriovorax sp.]|uniref:response regulator n=1 Tax=Halobacteriovorax sp. TaxID=2020862 RepID=UPI003565B2BE
MNNGNNLPQILLVDDDSGIRGVISDLLTSKGYRVVQAADGLEATLKMKNQTFNLIITDLNMPKKDGIKLTNEIIAANGPPVLLMTGELETYDIKLKSLKNTVLLPKPFNPKIVVALVNKILNENK